MNNRSAVHVVTGGQFGSEAKGAVTAALVRRMRHENPQRQITNVRVGGPNAGHTAYDTQGRAWALRQIPQCAVIDDPLVLLAVAPGSEIDLRVLYDEVHRLETAGLPVLNRLAISAITWLTSAWVKAPSLTKRTLPSLSSTMMAELSSCSPHAWRTLLLSSSTKEDQGNSALLFSALLTTKVPVPNSTSSRLMMVVV